MKHNMVGKMPRSSPRMCCLLFINITKINHQGFQMEWNWGRTIQTEREHFTSPKLSVFSACGKAQLIHKVTTSQCPRARQDAAIHTWLQGQPAARHSPLLSMAALRFPLTAGLPACSQVHNCFCSNLSTSNTATSSLRSPVCNAFLLSIDFVSISH